MRKPRDLDAALQTLEQRAKGLKERRVRQLGELVAATGADALDAETLAGGLLAMMEGSDRPRRRAGASVARRSFSGGHATLRTALEAATLALRRATAMRHRAEAARARTDTREWAVKRRARTRQLIELGGLVLKSKLVELTGDDRAVIYGALLGAARRLCEEDGEQMLAFWGRRGHRAFAAEAAEAAEKEKPDLG